MSEATVSTADTRHVTARLLIVAALAACVFAGVQIAPAEEPDRIPRVVLGERLFRDVRFSSPNGDLQSSCRSCHMVDDDPQGPRAFTDFLARSWVSWRSADPRRDGVRNAPTILDSGEMPVLHFDGEFGSLEALVRGTISGRTLGWMPGEEEAALDHAFRFIVNDAGDAKTGEDSYKDLFGNAYRVDLRNLSRDEVIEFVSGSVADYVRTLKTRRNSPYDEFIRSNDLPERPDSGESPGAFAQRLLAVVSAKESSGALRTTRGFDATALRGMKTFFRSTGEGSAGNCATCHAPPLFSDSSFHNTGITQSEYDRLHGDDSFSALAIPDAATAIRPSVQFREIPSRQRPGWIDLGHWNFVKLTGSSLRRAGDSDDEFLQRMVGTFKTPTLRNLAYSNPYMHNGAFFTLEEVLAEIARLSAMARDGRVRAADEELGRIRISEADFASLIAFLEALNDR